MAARKQLWHPNEVRQKIQASQLINRLTKHVKAPKPGLMDPSQVTAALGLLKKAVPDLSSTELKGEGGGPVKISIAVKDGSVL